MFDIILACDSNFGIGFQNSLPWKCSEELKIFKEKTQDSILIMGSKTFNSLSKDKNGNPFLKNRTLIEISKKGNSIQNGLLIAQSLDKKIFIAGGSSIYHYFLKNYFDSIDNLHISIFKKEYECDTYVNIDLTKFTIICKDDYDEFIHYVLKPNINGETEYLNLLKKTIVDGQFKNARNGETISLFGEKLTFDLTEGFPLLTTKKMFFRGIAEELLFFLRGETQSKLLEEKGVNIWKGNTNREFLDKNGFENRIEGMMGPMYGYQWRYYNAEYNEETGKPIREDEGFNQIDYVIETILKDPQSRRILLTDYNPLQAKQGVLFPCHSIIIQFYVRSKFLDMTCYNRSQDLFHGVPFNIASSALLLTLISKLTNLTAGKLTMFLGDCHIYSQHVEAVKTQLNSRIKFPFPKLIISENINLNELSIEDFILNDYKSHPAIKVEMVP